MKKARQARKFLSPSEAAGRLGCAPRTLATWSGDGPNSIPGLRKAVRRLPSKHRRYDEKAIEAYMASLERAPR